MGVCVWASCRELRKAACGVSTIQSGKEIERRRARERERTNILKCFETLEKFRLYSLDAG